MLFFSSSDAPRFREEPDDLAADPGQQATLTCAVDANPPPKVTWTRHGCRACPQVGHRAGALMLDPIWSATKYNNPLTVATRPWEA